MLRRLLTHQRGRGVHVPTPPLSIKITLSFYHASPHTTLPLPALLRRRRFPGTVRHAGWMATPLSSSSQSLQRRLMSSTYATVVPCARLNVGTATLARVTSQPTLPPAANIYVIDLRKKHLKNKKKPNTRTVMSRVIAAHRGEAEKALAEASSEAEKSTPPLIFLVKTEDSTKQAAHRQQVMEDQLKALNAFGEFHVCVLSSAKSRHWSRYVPTDAPKMATDTDASDTATPTLAAAGAAAATLAGGVTDAANTTRHAEDQPESASAVKDGNRDKGTEEDEEEWEEVWEEVPEDAVGGDTVDVSEESADASAAAVAAATTTAATSTTAVKEVNRSDSQHAAVDAASLDTHHPTSHTDFPATTTSDDKFNAGHHNVEEATSAAPTRSTASTTAAGSSVSAAIAALLNASSAPPTTPAPTVASTVPEAGKDAEVEELAEFDLDGPFTADDAPPAAAKDEVKPTASTTHITTKNNVAEKAEESANADADFPARRAEADEAAADTNVDKSDSPSAVGNEASVAVEGKEEDVEEEMEEEEVEEVDDEVAEALLRDALSPQSPAAPSPSFMDETTPKPVFTDVVARAYSGASTMYLSDRVLSELPVTANVLVIDRLDWQDNKRDAISAALQQVDESGRHVLLCRDAYVPQSTTIVKDGFTYADTRIPFVLVFRTGLSPPAAQALQQRFNEALRWRLPNLTPEQQTQWVAQNDRTTVCVLSAQETAKGGENPLEKPTKHSSSGAAARDRAGDNNSGPDRVRNGSEKEEEEEGEKGVIRAAATASDAPLSSVADDVAASSGESVVDGLNEASANFNKKGSSADGVAVDAASAEERKAALMKLRSRARIFTFGFFGPTPETTTSPSAPSSSTSSTPQSGAFGLSSFEALAFGKPVASGRRTKFYTGARGQRSSSTRRAGHHHHDDSSARLEHFTQDTSAAAVPASASAELEDAEPSTHHDEASQKPSTTPAAHTPVKTTYYSFERAAAKKAAEQREMERAQKAAAKAKKEKDDAAVAAFVKAWVEKNDVSALKLGSDAQEAEAAKASDEAASNVRPARTRVKSASRKRRS